MADATAHLPNRYHSNQIMLHWLVVSLVLLQFLGGESMARAMELAYAGGGRLTDGIVVVHATFGTVILFAMLARLVVRLRHGAPPPPETEPRPLQILSRGVHYAFYGLLIAMPLFGIAAIAVLSETLGTLHGLASWLLLGLAALHVAGALFHAVKRDGVVGRVFTTSPPHND